LEKTEQVLPGSEVVREERKEWRAERDMSQIKCMQI
jgi:hypothetical protein